MIKAPTSPIRNQVILYLFISMLCFSCNQTIDTQVEQRASNEQAFQSLSKNTSYTRTSLPGLGGDSFIYMKWTNRGTGTIHPKATDAVAVHYSLYLLSDWIQRGDSADRIDSTTGNSNPTTLTLSQTIVGFSIALQNMVQGDQVEFAIPWYLGYGASSSQRVGPYSALYYKVELVSIK